jgi:TusA-related sulfurtransferase
MKNHPNLQMNCIAKANSATNPKFVPDLTLDITRDVCPMTFVRTRLALDRLPSGAILLVVLRGNEPAQNVPRTAREQGHEILQTAQAEDGLISVWIRKA